MELGIFTPYQRCETTVAALRLADFALTIPYNVKLLTHSSIHKGIHPYWDSRVISCRDNNAYKWANNCLNLIWFEHHPDSYKKSKVVSEKARHWWLPGWHKVHHHVNYKMYDRIIAPCRSVKDKFVEHLCQGDPKPVAWCMWDSGLATVGRMAGYSKSGQAGLYVPIDGLTMDMAGLMVLRTLYELLYNNKGVYVTLDCAKSWNRQTRKMVKELELLFAERFNVTYGTNLVWQAKYMNEHDWVWLPSLKIDYGQIITRSLSCGTPVICYSVDPAISVLAQGKTAHLLSCDTMENWLGAQIAVPTASGTAKELHEVMTDTVMLERCRRCNWKLDDKRVAFEKFWRREWQV